MVIVVPREFQGQKPKGPQAPRVFWLYFCIAPKKCGAKYEGFMNFRGKFALQIHGTMHYGVRKPF